jgi:hypothetical protein
MTNIWSTRQTIFRSQKLAWLMPKVGEQAVGWRDLLHYDLALNYGFNTDGIILVGGSMWGGSA